MPGPELYSDKGDKQKKSISIKEEREVERPEEKAGAEKVVEVRNISREEKKAEPSKASKTWKKIVSAKVAAKVLATRSREEHKIRTQWGDRSTLFLKKYPDSLLHKDLKSLSPAEAKRYLLFVEPKMAGISDSTESMSSSQDCRRWDLPVEPDPEQQKRLVGVLKASEARSRVRALRLRYTRMRRHRVEAILQEDNTYPLFR